MLPLYLGSLALGGLLILASIFMGGGDHDAEAEAEAGLDGELEAEVEAEADVGGGADKETDLAHAAGEAGGTWLPFLSLRFWTFALATFGASGALLDLLGFSDLVAAPSAGATGVGVGWAVAWAFHRLKKDAVTGNVGLRSLAGREGRLLLSVGPDKLGKVRVEVDGQDVDLPARTMDDRLLAPQQQVLVVEIKDGVAQVTSIGRGGT